MKLKVDWHYLRPALIVASLSMVFSAVLIFLGHNYHADMVDHHALKNAEFSEAEMQMEELREEKEIIAAYLDNFIAMQKSGIFDAKHRVDWVDSVNEARRKMKLPIVRYQIFPQRAYNAEYLVDEGLVNVVTSQIKLEAGLLHEGDLADLFSWMDKYAPGQIHLSNCDLKRVELVFGYYSHGPNLNVNCELEWFSVIPLEQE